MAAKLHRKKNILELLAPLWGVLIMAAHVGTALYFCFIAESYESLDAYESWIRYLIWGAAAVIATLSFVPEDVTAVVRHTLFYLLPGALFLGGMWWYTQNVFDEEKLDARRKIMAMFMKGYTETDYVSYYMKYAVVSTLGLCAAVAAFCAIKTHLSASGWINKHIK